MFRLGEKGKELFKRRKNRAEYTTALYQIRKLLGHATNREEKCEILSYAIKVIKRDLVCEGLSSSIYHGRQPDWQCCIPIPIEFWSAEITPIDLSITDILALPYSFQKLAGAISHLMYAPFDKSKSYYTATYYPEIDLAIIENGIHHTAVASAGVGGVIEDCTILHMAPAFEVLTTDGGVWIEGSQGSPFDVEDFRFALLYTLAKMRHEL